MQTDYQFFDDDNDVYDEGSDDNAGIIAWQPEWVKMMADDSSEFDDYEEALVTYSEDEYDAFTVAPSRWPVRRVILLLFLLIIMAAVLVFFILPRLELWINPPLPPLPLKPPLQA